ncbi:hypothetical protein M413DRAFT_449957 [Hebeloma cylindrosporum]|uniref:Transcription initiation factor TFIID subunit 4 n=1 Tax=Hebeloma cylindrosporum TaxID=76867 RepID=A0A0C3BDX4_HEBCY|nr:hypothetical protein M413DRAFT_449957 [Hebeloma cylindrosporum h7]
MKAEETTTPTTTTTTTTTPQPAATSTPTYTAQWAQQTAGSPYYQYTSHYPQAAYATHYNTYAPQTTQGQQSQTQTQRTPAPIAPYQTSTYSLNTSGNAGAVGAPSGAGANTSSSGMDTSDVATLNDALGSAGVDLRAEEESLQRTHETHQTYRSYEDRTRKQPPKPSFDTRFLGTTMRTIGTKHKVARIPEESVNYLALALRARLQDLVSSMVTAAHHRTDTQFDRPASLYEDGSPMWSIVVRSDVGKQLAALEKIEREEETRVRKERKERAELTAAHTAALAAQATGMGVGGQNAENGDEMEGSAKKKRKKEGPGVTARNMSEDVRKKMSNAVATQAAGLGGRYSWMTAANASSPAPKPKPAPAPSVASPAITTTATTTIPATTTAPAAASSSWARPYVPLKKPAASARDTPTEDDSKTLITMRDALFVIEKERGHGGGRGAARGWV